MIIVIMTIVNISPIIDIEAAEKSFFTGIEKYISEAVLPYADFFQIDTTGDLFLGMAMPTFITDGSKKLSLLENTWFYPLTDGKMLLGLIEVDSYGENYSYSFVCNQSLQLSIIKYPIVVINDQKIEIESGNDLNIEIDKRTLNENILNNTYRLILSPVYPDGMLINIPYVDQVYSYACWAGCLASVYDYMTGTTFNTQFILDYAGIYYGATMNQTRNVAYDLGLSPSFINSTLTTTQLMNNIYNGYPMISGFLYGGTTGHMMVIRGYNSGSSYFHVLLMDPENGFAVVTSTSGSNLTFSYLGATFTLNEYFCVY